MDDESGIMDESGLEFINLTPGDADHAMSDDGDISFAPEPVDVDAIPDARQTGAADDDDDDDNEVEDIPPPSEDEGSGSDDAHMAFKGPCQTTCRPQWLLEHEKAVERKAAIRHLKLVYRDKMGVLKGKLRELRRTRREMQEELDRLGGNNKRDKETWPEMLRDHLENGEGRWSDVYSISCKEGNMSPNLNNVHPDLRLVEPESYVAPREFLQGPGSAGGRAEDPRPRALPWHLVFRILKLCLVFEGAVVHAVSRFDPYRSPAEMPYNSFSKPCFHHRLVVGRSGVSIAAAPNPNRLLAPLRVCRAWHFLGCHLFYGENTFAFSSLGEWGRFAKGIGANIQRLQRVEILWLGSQWLSHPVDKKTGRFISRRTHAVTWLAEALRLKTLGIYLPESCEGRMRRKHEKKGMVGYMKGRTTRQPNWRAARSLRTVQGIDLVYCLRGLSGVEFWDFDKWLEDRRAKHPVRDFSFVVDVNSAVQRAKSDEDRKRSRLRNLYPLLDDFKPPEELRKLVIALSKPQKQKPAIVPGDNIPRSETDTDSVAASRRGRNADQTPSFNDAFSEAAAVWEAELASRSRALEVSTSPESEGDRAISSCEGPRPPGGSESGDNVETLNVIDLTMDDDEDERDATPTPASYAAGIPRSEDQEGSLFLDSGSYVAPPQTERASSNSSPSAVAGQAGSPNESPLFFSPEAHGRYERGATPAGSSISTSSGRGPRSVSMSHSHRSGRVKRERLGDDEGVRGSLPPANGGGSAWSKRQRSDQQRHPGGCS